VAFKFYPETIKEDEEEKAKVRDAKRDSLRTTGDMLG